MRRPISDKQLAANRANALKSTGPRTPRGKARSSMNRLLHGLRGRTGVLPNEDPRQFDAFARAVRAELRPRAAIEAVLVEQVIRTAWMVRRAGAAEGEVVRQVLENYRKSGESATPAKLLADALVGDPRAEPYLNVDLYADQLQRSFFTALRRLHRAKRARVAGGVAKTNEPIWGQRDVEIENEVNRIFAKACAAGAGGGRGGASAPLRRSNPFRGCLGGAPEEAPGEPGG